MATKAEDASTRLLQAPLLVRSQTLGTGQEKASEEGRKRSHTLPPIAREHTKSISPHKTTTVTSSQFSRDYTYLYHGDNEAGGTLWHLSQRQKQVMTEEKIINHLRKKLNRRVEKRINRLLYTEQYEERGQSRKTLESQRQKGRQANRRTTKVSIFNKYTEYGEKIPNSDHKRSTSEDRLPIKILLEPLPIRSRSISPRRADRQSSAESAGSRGCRKNSTENSVETTETPSSKHPLPDIAKTQNSRNSAKQNDNTSHRKSGHTARRGSGILKSANSGVRKKSSGRRVSLNEPSKDDVSQSIGSYILTSDQPCDATGHVFVADNENNNDIKLDDEAIDKEIANAIQRCDTPTIDVDELEKEFNNLEVSPVPTPSVFRPETREQGRLSEDDRVTQILLGKLNVKSPPDHKILRIYISSAAVDSQAESTALVKCAYPELRRYSLERGCELQIIDPHWCSHDAVTDDNALPDISIQLLDQCQETRGVHFVSFLSHMYGPVPIPSTIPATEFDAISASVNEDRQQQLRHTAIHELKREATRVVEAADKEKENDNSEQSDLKKKGAKKTHQDRKLSQAIISKELETTKQLPTLLQSADSGVSLRETPETIESDIINGEGNAVIPDWENETKIQEFIQKLNDDHGLLQLLVRGMGEDVIDLQILYDWYMLDENAVPAIYKLQPISTHFKDITRNDATKRQLAKTSWSSTCQKLQKIIQKYAVKVLGKETATKYFASMCEREHEQGLIVSDDPNVHCMWYKRENTESVPDSQAKTHLGTDANTSLQKLSKEVTDKLNQQNIHRYLVTWGKDGINPGTHRAHRIYLERMCEDFVEAFKSNIDQVIAENKQDHGYTNGLFEEIVPHVNLCHERAKNFHGRKELLNKIKTYVRSDCNQPIIIHGKSGRGKTSLVCRAAKDMHKWFKGGNVNVIMRSIGATSHSTNIRLLIRSICLQMCYIYSLDTRGVPEDYKGLVNDLDNRMSVATEDSPLVIVIDSLDQLSDENDAKKLLWLPKELPPNVHMVLSTLPDEKFGCLNSLQKMYADCESDVFVEVPDLPLTDAIAMLNHWLEKSSRSLTQEQNQSLMAAFKVCSTPLYLKVAFSEALRWPSTMPGSDVKLSNTVGKVATVIFGRLEKEYGDILVKRTLGYITASRNGVMSSEMEDLLSLDEPVMEEVSGHFKPPIRRCPPIAWLRLKFALKNYIVERSADGVKTLKWFHSQFHDAAIERYMNQRDKAPSYHKAMAEYYLGKWSDGKPKPFGSNEIGVDRYVIGQPLYFPLLDEEGKVTKRIYNLRKLSELPWHLLKAQQFPDLKSECLCNFEWVLAKLCATSLRALLDDYQMALGIEPKDPDLNLLTETLQLSHKVVEIDPTQLASQLVGRLHKMITKDVPVAPQDPLKFPACHPFLKQAQHSSVASLIPSMTCLSEPGGILFDVLSGHTDVITAVTVTTDGVRALTASKDDTMKLWSLGTGKVTKTIKGVGRDVLSVRMASENRIAVSSEVNCLRLWDVNTGICLHTISDFIDEAILTIAGEGKLLVALFDGANVMRTWDLADNMNQIQELQFEEKSVHKDKSILVSHGSYGDQVLHAYRSSNCATVQNCRSGKEVHKLISNDMSASICALGVNREYFIVCSRVPFMKLQEIYILELFDIKNGKYLRNIRGCSGDNVSEIHINNLGSHAMCVCPSLKTNTTNIAVWNLETEDHKHLAHHVDVSVIAACGDFRFCLTGSQTENTLRVWNLSNNINKPATKLRQSAGVAEIIQMKDNPRYVIGRAMDNGQLSVWNVVNSKCKGNAVRIEHGLVGPSDVVLLHNAKVFILTDRALSQVAQETQQVFQTIHVYNLKTKRYENRLTAYIIPSPPHEYVLLDDETLMGLNDNRGHFVLWNLPSGRVIDRIKATHPENLKFDNSLTEQAKTRAKKRLTTAKMTPWDRRSESLSAQHKRRESEIEEERKHLEELQKEKENSIEKFLISEDLSTMVASYYAHHLCVFDIARRNHIHTLRSDHSMLLLHVATLTYDGNYLVHTNYDEELKTSYVTLWDCKEGTLRKRLKNEKDVCAVAITNDASRLVFAKTNNELRVWDPFESNSLRRLKGYKGVNFNMGAKIFIMDDGARALVFSGDVSLWDINKGQYLAVFTPDMSIECCSVVMNGKVIAVGLRDATAVITLKYVSREITGDDDQAGHDMFGEDVSSSSDDDDEEET